MYAEQYELTLSCYFDFQFFPFDSHKCGIEFGDWNDGTRNLNLGATSVQYRGHPFITADNDSTANDSIIINNLPYPYEFRLQSLPPFEMGFGDGNYYSYTGVLITLERKSLGYLLVGYYYPTTAFALLSMISYLIDADDVRLLNS